MRKIFVVGQHGNEQLPIKAANTLINQIEVVVANPKAVNAGVRFLETDLNRSFPGNSTGKYEEEIADRLKTKLEKYDEVIDFHTATCGTPMFAIVTRMTKKHLEVVRKLGIRKVVYMEKSIASGKSLIDHVRVGVSVEAGREKTKSVQKRIEQVMKHYMSGKMMSENKIEIFSVFEIIKRSEKLKKLPKGLRNFESTKIDGLVGYPVLAREKSYPEVLCLLAHRISLNSIILDKDK